MKSTTTSTARDLLDKITGKRASIAAAEAEIAELERRARWAEGAERRDRLETIATQATELAATTTDTATAIVEALTEVTAAIRRARALAKQYNAAVSDIRRQLADEHVTQSSGNIPPSPADAGVAPINNGIRVGDLQVHTVTAVDLINSAVQAGQQSEPTPAAQVRLTSQAPALTGPFWRLPTGRTMVATDLSGNQCVRITRPEFFADQWGLDLRDLPEHILDELTDRERAQLAEQLLTDPDSAA